MIEHILLNENGRSVWRHSQNKNIFVEKPYSWCNRYILLDETVGRMVCGEGTLAWFEELECYDLMVPVTPKEYSVVKRKYKEIYDSQERIEDELMDVLLLGKKEWRKEFLGEEELEVLKQTVKNIMYKFDVVRKEN